MAKVLICNDFDSSTQTCNAQSWADQSTFADYLPTMAEANVVGSAFLSSLIVIAFVVRAIKPQRL